MITRFTDSLAELTKAIADDKYKDRNEAHAALNKAEKAANEDK
jgi:hypothetical protein